MKKYISSGNEEIRKEPVKPGTVRSEQILIIKELYKTANFTCHAFNDERHVNRTIEVVVSG